VEIVGQGAGERPDQIVTPVLPQFDVEDFDFQHVAGLGAGNRDRAGQDMAGQHPLVLGMHRVAFGRHMKLLAVRQHVRAAGNGIDGDFVAAGDREHGF
jgi:hypothetical protein